MYKRGKSWLLKLVCRLKYTVFTKRTSCESFHYCIYNMKTFRRHMSQHFVFNILPTGLKTVAQRVVGL